MIAGKQATNKQAVNKFIQIINNRNSLIKEVQKEENLKQNYKEILKSLEVILI